MMKPFLDVLGLISASLLVRSRYREMPTLASLNAKNRSKSPFSMRTEQDLSVPLTYWFGVLNYWCIHGRSRWCRSFKKRKGVHGGV